MTQEQKDLLLKDLCARLPYGVKVQIPDKYGGHTSVIENIDIDGYVVDCEGALTEIEWARPYLFPLSSMTDEQMCELLRLHNQQYFVLREYTGTYKDSIPHCIGERNVIDWLNKNHFDYRCLIENGLAIDATGLNIY